MDNVDQEIKQYSILLKAFKQVNADFKLSRDYFLKLYDMNPDPEYAMYLGNIFLLILNLPLIPYFARLVAIPRTILVPVIFFFSFIGVYLVTFKTFDIYI